MLALLMRVLGVLLAIVGAACIVVGGWFASSVGSNGTATFSTSPATSGPLVIGPDVLNRTDDPVEVTVTGDRGAVLWAGLAGPADASSALGDTPTMRVTGVIVRDWALARTGSASLPTTSYAAADLWRRAVTGTDTLELTIKQDQAPETLILTADKGTITKLTLTWERKSWFVQSVVTALTGLFLLVAGGLTLWSQRHKPLLPARLHPRTATGAGDGTDDDAQADDDARADDDAQADGDRADDDAGADGDGTDDDARADDAQADRGVSA